MSLHDLARRSAERKWRGKLEWLTDGHELFVHVDLAEIGLPGVGLWLATPPAVRTLGVHLPPAPHTSAFGRVER